MLSPHLEVDRLGVAYGAVQALHDVSLRVEAGSIAALIGVNGAGKTTLLRAVTGLATPADGSIRFAGKVLGGRPPHEVVAAGVAMVPEGRRIFPYMSVLDNLRLGAYRRQGRQSIAADLEAVLDRFPRLRERHRQLAGSLSGGEQQMVAIGRALMSRPRLLLLDEPSLGLAPLMVREVAREIRRIHEAAGVTILLVEQNARMALALASHGFVLESGRVALAGPAADLARDARIRALYLGG
jgi:branched-chain amino acid transport system ATP-binding protein